MHLGGLGGPSVEGEAKPVLGPGGATDRRSLSAVGRLYEMVRKGRANPLWPPVGPDRRGDTQEVTKKPASRRACSGLQKLGTRDCALSKPFYAGVLRRQEYKLANVQKQFDGLRFADLDPEDRRRIDDAIIHATIVRQDEPSKDQSSVYLIFERLNTGGTNLQPQEVRVALYRARCWLSSGS